MASSSVTVVLLTPTAYDFPEEINELFCLRFIGITLIIFVVWRFRLAKRKKDKLNFNDHMHS